MCDETESSEPLGGSGSMGGGGGRGVRKGTGKEGGGSEVGKCTGRKGCWDTSHYNINQRPGTEHRGRDVPELEVRDLRRRKRGEET